MARYDRSLLETAARLARSRRGAPRQSDLRRAVSTIYYALFQALSGEAADLLVGRSARQTAARRRVHRAIEHRAAKNAAEALAASRSASDELRRFCRAFTRAKEERHAADYDPFLRLRQEEVRAAVEAGHAALNAFERLDRAERLELVTRCLFRDRP
ncbi:MAG: hypothetical protein KatS3mg117_0856 [Geminicoccaceae bacterium]|nr:MAG: hypothetical protein KatS3mg117_0856 [Geminicoccaceae bacterium]